MEKKLISLMAGVLIIAGTLIPVTGSGQNQKAIAKKYLTVLPAGKPENNGTIQKYRMTAVYINRDQYGKFTGKLKVTGDYSRGFKDDSVTWNNVFISNSDSFSDSFPEGKKQDYMENIKYVPSDQMIKEEAFKDFPASTENVFARNLIWDMLTFDTYAWNFSNNLKINEPYVVNDASFEFNIAEIGKYKHNKILVCWKGISELNGQLCAVIDFNAIDNIVELSMPAVRTKGTEQYWGTVWVSLKTKDIEKGLMYSGTNQEIEVPGMKDKFLINTIRELDLERIQ